MLDSNNNQIHRKVAVVLCNFGGPNKIEEVENVLFNLFNDKAIISLPQPFRWLLAKLISNRRAPKAAKLYELMGGKSPILENTMAQGDELQKILHNESIDDIHFQYRVFIAMRYNHPTAEKIIPEINDYGATDVILLPLYPQYSVTTTGSSFKDFLRHENKLDSNIKIHRINYYHQNNNFIESCVDLIQNGIEKIYQKYGKDAKFKLLFSAHGLPQKIINAGDLYQKHIEESVALIVKKLKNNNPNLDYIICYQSKVGPLKWLEPSTESAIEDLAHKYKDIGIILFPIAFTSEHIETLVELDVEYRELAEEKDIPFYERIPTVSTYYKFIECLKEQVRRILTESN